MVELVEDAARTQAPSSVRRTIVAGLSAWFVFVAVDFLGHGVLLSGYWDATSQFWRPDDELFRLIPIAYATFLVYCFFLVWVLGRAFPNATRLVHGGLVGAGLALVFGIVGWLGAFTVLPMPWSAVVIWTAWGIVESAGAGMAAVRVLTSVRPLRQLGVVAAFAAGIVVAGIILQTTLGLR